MGSPYVHRMHHNWQDNEIRELLRLRAQERFRVQITGTVKDAVVFSTITRLLAQQGIHRSRDQVITKLKGLKKQYRQYKELNKGRRNRSLWPFFEEADRAFGDHSPLEPSAPSPTSSVNFEGISTQAAGLNSEEHEQVVVELWDDTNQNQKMSRHIAPMEDDEEEDYGSPEQSQSAKYSAPPRKKKATVMNQVNTMISATMTQIKEMDTAMQRQEDARLKRLMDHEKDLQKNLIEEMLSMHRTISEENHRRHMEIVDKVMSRLPSTSYKQ